MPQQDLYHGTDSENYLRKRKISSIFKELNIIPDRFTGRVIISFKEGGVSYVEIVETSSDETWSCR